MDLHIEDIRKKLVQLRRNQQLLFGALTSEKLYSNYVYFHQRYEWGSPNVLLEAIGMVYQSLFVKKPIEKNEIEEYITAIDFVTPDTEDFSEVFVSFALDACTSVYSCLSFMLDQKTDHIIDIATYAIDTIDMFIQVRDDLYVNSPALEAKISNDSLMLAEKERQQNLIDRLKQIKDEDISDNLIQSLKDDRAIVNITEIK